uniref:Helicase n=1 Tax=Marseillevirus LCMAC102 TaxID=2506603 RepID=A0A481YT28_9VIRU|nr:MAG: helicase [Marseillevirus LCMAC102]
MLTLRESQQEAIDCFEGYFYGRNKNERGIMSCCCGFGKTFVTYKIIEQCIGKGELFFVYVTSRIKLVNQAIKDRLEYLPNVDLEILGLCSDIDKNNQGINKLNKEGIKAAVFLNISRKKPLLIITTYDSAHHIVEALEDEPDLQPDLIILDEAHNTTGDKQAQKRKIIDPDLDTFSSNKYLYITATPVELIKKNKKSGFRNDETIYTMKNEKIYGKIFYEYSFYEGFRDGILCKFKTVHFEEKNEIDKQLRKIIQQKDKIEKQAYYFRQVADFMLESIQKYHLKHSLVYLSDKSKALCFKQIIDENPNADVEISTVLSGQPKRERRLNEFNFKQRGRPKILLSVGIYNEGIDIRLIDSVLFVEKRNSETVIVQNIGRCLRNTRDTDYYKKECAYVLMPTILHELDNNEKFSSNFKPIRHIIDELNRQQNNFFCKKFVKDKREKDDEYNIDDDELKSFKEDQDTKEVEKGQEYQTPEERKTSYDNAYDEVKNEKLLPLNITDTTERVSGISLQKVKDIISRHSIKTLVQYTKLVKSETESDLLLCDFPHKYFGNEFISYGDLFGIGTFTQDEAMNFIYDNFTSKPDNKITNGKEWNEYFYDYINDRLEETGRHQYLEDVIKIPLKPKSYYLGEWDKENGWATFLSTDPSRTPFKTILTNNTIAKNSNSNLSNILNYDKQKVRLAQGKFNEFVGYDPEKHLPELKGWVDKFLGINCVLIPRILTRRGSENYKSVQIWAKRIQDVPTCRIPAIIYVFTQKLRYDPDIIACETQFNAKRTGDRTREQTLPPNNTITEEIELLDVMAREYIQMNKTN